MLLQLFGLANAVRGPLWPFKYLNDPLRAIPGPWLWSITRLPYVYHLYRGSLVHEIGRLHRKYGEKVRIAPDEISFTTNDAWKDIYSRRPDRLVLPRDQVWQRSGPQGTNNLTTAPMADHDRMRKALNPAFELSGLAEKEPIIQKHTLQMIAKIRMIAEEGRPVDLASWMSFCAFDTIGELTFGSDIFHCNELGEYPASILSMFRHAKNQAKAACLRYSPLAFIERLPSWMRPWNALTQNREDALINLLMSSLGQRTKTPHSKQNFTDLMGVLIEGTERGELNQAEMGANAGLLLGGGGETVAAALGGILNYLLRDPPALKRLTDEIRERHATSLNITGSSLEKIDYLTWVIQEGMRLSCPIPCGIPRVVPGDIEGTSICDVWVPARTHVAVQTWSLFRNPTRWHRPLEFSPERWSSLALEPASAFYNDDRASVRPFSSGAMRCMGQPIAWLEMRLAIAHLVFAFDLEPSNGQHDGKILRWEDQTTGTLWDRQPFNVKASVTHHKEHESHREGQNLH
ncbi:MAG: hypothetical protein Q9159_006449 [Coniocarpon cinnabarinum]